MNPHRLDVLIGLVALVEFQIEASVADAPADEIPIGRMALALAASGLMVRTRAPLYCVAATFACFAITSHLGSEFENSLIGPFFALFAAVFSLAALTDGWRLVTGMAIAVAGTVAALVTDAESFGPGDVVFVAALLVIGPLLAGRGLRSRLRLGTVLREKAEAAGRDGAEAAERAAADERTRIARELHDVVSHALSAMVVQASAARRLAVRDPESARSAFATVEESGREALDEMRRLLGVLRRGDEELALAPQPSLAHLSGLLKRATAAGLSAELEVEGERRPLPPGADLIAFRVVQEALHRALERGAGSAGVRLVYGEDLIDLEIRDDGGGERDLLGVQERVALYGGRLVAGPQRGGGHTVRARLPLGALA
jgi:signal transduction histidine kinase